MNYRLSIILLFASIWITNCSQPPEDATDDIIAANDNFTTLFNAHNGKAIGDLYTTNGRLLPVNSPVIEGQEAIGQFWNAVFDMGIDTAELKTKHVESFNNTAIEEGAYSLFDSNKNKLDEGKYIIVWKKVNNQWRLDRDMFSSNMPVVQKDDELPSEDTEEQV